MSTGRTPRHSAYTAAQSELDEARARLSAALLPVLRARDAEGFLRVVTEAEEIWGDMSRFHDMSVESLHLIMADMLQSPRKYLLPRWPTAAIAAPDVPPDAPPAEEALSAREPPPDRDRAFTPESPLAPAPATDEAPLTSPTSPRPESASPMQDAFNLHLPGFEPTIAPARRPVRRRQPRGPNSLGGNQLPLF